MRSQLRPEPRFSVVTPVFDPNRDAFVACVRSVLEQVYPGWEWCLVDDNSSDPWIWKFLTKLARRHPNIKVSRRSENGGISVATNDAIAMAKGEFLAFLDHDDILHREALSVVNHEIFVDPSLDFIYTDEDKIDESGDHFDFFHKPDWSPERLLGQNYCCHLSVIRTELVRSVGGLRSEVDGAQDHDLLLRISERTDRIRHVPRILYHWRVSATSHASSVEAKPYTADAMRRTIQDACDRRGIDADLLHLPQGYFRVRRRISETPRTSLVIPTRGTVGSIWGLEGAFIENLLLSSQHKTTYPNIEYVIVYDSVTDPNLLDRISNLDLPIKLVEFTGKFNFSKKCNLGAIKSTGSRIIFVNDDMEVRTPDWIERTTVFLEDPTVGAAGPLLLYDNGLIESAGHTNTGPANFGNSMSPDSSYGIGWPLVLNREASGITGACLAIRRETFFQMGGFSEAFAENFNDVDLCMKLIASGHRIIWTPDAELYHFELKSRSRKIDPHERELLRRYWGHLVGHRRPDPFLPILWSPPTRDQNRDESVDR